MEMTKTISLAGLNSKLEYAALEVCEMLGICVNDDGIPLRVRKGQKFSVSLDKEGYRIIYRKKCEIFRGLTLLGRLPEGYVMSQEGLPDMLCYMVDESRNAVMNYEGARRMVRVLATLGYDSMMLYTEDTYEVPGYPYFGHMRGRFTEKELKELDAYADSFGIEIIPCIQTLAHLRTAIRWPGLRGFADTDDILLAGDDRTYDFIRAILETCSRCFKSRRINLGMDEAHMLGLGSYLKKNGYRKASDIMLEHLSRVAAICEELGLEPMIWSDMFFRMAFKGAYRVREGEIAPEIMAKVPKNVALVYWDYYSLDRQIFDHMVDCHLKFDNEVLFAGGAWKWSCIAPHNKFSLVSTKLQLDSCAERGLRKIIVTGWGDNGGEASQFSTLPVLLYFSERLYAGKDVPDVSREELNERSLEVFGTSFDDLLLFDRPNDMPGTAPGEVNHPVNPCKYLLYNDPLEGLFDKHMEPDVAERYAGFAKTLLAHRDDNRWGYIYNCLGTLCDLLSVKADLGVRITKAYLDDDREALRELAHGVIPACVNKLDVFTAAFRVQWYTENKTFGFTNEEIRLGGLRARLLSTIDRIDEYLCGVVTSIEELEQPRLWFDGRKDDDTRTPYICHNNWSANASVGQM